MREFSMFDLLKAFLSVHWIQFFVLVLSFSCRWFCVFVSVLLLHSTASAVQYQQILDTVSSSIKAFLTFFFLSRYFDFVVSMAKRNNRKMTAFRVHNTYSYAVFAWKSWIKMKWFLLFCCISCVDLVAYMNESINKLTKLSLLYTRVISILKLKCKNK